MSVPSKRKWRFFQFDSTTFGEERRATTYSKVPITNASSWLTLKIAKQLSVEVTSYGSSVRLLEYHLPSFRILSFGLSSSISFMVSRTSGNGLGCTDVSDSSFSNPGGRQSKSEGITSPSRLEAC